MERRSTNTIGHVHFQGDVWSNVGSSHGVGLFGGSTGGVVEAVGDDTNISLTIRAKNTAPLVLGSSGNDVFVAGSTAPWEGFIRAIDTAVSTPALFNDTDAGRVAETTHTITGVSSQTAGTPTAFFVIANSPNLPAAVSIAGAYAASTADQVHVRFVKGSTVAVAATTCTLNFLVARL